MKNLGRIALGLALLLLAACTYPANMSAQYYPVPPDQQAVTHDGAMGNSGGRN
jgi:outer membrane biogenesis lipoprotein LolB